MRCTSLLNNIISALWNYNTWGWFNWSDWFSWGDWFGWGDWFSWDDWFSWGDWLNLNKLFIYTDNSENTSSCVIL